MKDKGGIYNEETTKGLAQILLIGVVRDFDVFFFYQWEAMLRSNTPESLLREGARCLFSQKMRIRANSFSLFYRCPILGPSASETIPLQS